MSDNPQFAASNEAAQRYEQNIVSNITQSHTHVVFDHVPLCEGERVLDVACGTGIVTRVAVERFNNLESIVCVDLNPAMLEIAQANTPTTDIPIEWRESDICALPFSDDSFDVVLCQQGLQYVPDKLAALQHMKRVLKPGGRLVFTVWSQVHRHHAALADALRQHISEEAGASCLAPFAWKDADTIRKLVDDVSLQAVEMEMIESTTRILASADAVRSFIAYMGSRSPFGTEIEDTLAALTQDVFSALQVYREGNEFVMPSQAHLVQARTASA